MLFVALMWRLDESGILPHRTVAPLSGILACFVGGLGEGRWRARTVLLAAFSAIIYVYMYVIDYSAMVIDDPPIGMVCAAPFYGGPCFAVGWLGSVMTQPLKSVFRRNEN